MKICIDTNDLKSNKFTELLTSLFDHVDKYTIVDIIKCMPFDDATIDCVFSKNLYRIINELITEVEIFKQFMRFIIRKIKYNIDIPFTLYCCMVKVYTKIGSEYKLNDNLEIRHILKKDNCNIANIYIEWFFLSTFSGSVRVNRSIFEVDYEYKYKSTKHEIDLYIDEDLDDKHNDYTDISDERYDIKYYTSESKINQEIYFLQISKYIPNNLTNEQIQILGDLSDQNSV